jgi:hypothetical protein
MMKNHNKTVSDYVACVLEMMEGQIVKDIERSIGE